MARTDDRLVMILEEPRESHPDDASSFGFYWWDGDNGRYEWWMSMWGEPGDTAESLLVAMEDILRKGMQEELQERQRANDVFDAGVYV